MLKRLLPAALLLMVPLAANAWSFDEFKENINEMELSAPWKKEDNSAAQRAKYLNNVKKEDLKEEYGRKKLELHPNPYMTVEEYEMLSAPKDKKLEEIPIPKPEKASDMKYVPEYDYEIVRYNNPPGSPEISLDTDFKQRKQQNIQGIVSPDYTILVYPSVYYYHKENVVTCDLFVIPLEQKGNALTRIKKANVMHRDQEPILSTEKSTSEYGIFSHDKIYKQNNFFHILNVPTYIKPNNYGLLEPLTFEKNLKTKYDDFQNIYNIPYSAFKSKLSLEEQKKLLDGTHCAVFNNSSYKWEIKELKFMPILDYKKYQINHTSIQKNFRKIIKHSQKLEKESER